MTIFRGALVLMVIAMMATVLGYSAVAAMTINMAWILFLFGLVFAAIFSLDGRRTASVSKLPHPPDAAGRR